MKQFIKDYWLELLIPSLVIGSAVSILILTIVVAGQPGHKTLVFEESGIMCRMWDTKWGFSSEWENKQCYKLTEIVKGGEE